ncbi:MAG TPA: hypothetical protein PLI45_01305 [Candidatus Woesebacteria bacterium]|nr:hypothetical protein [Candidatus Woesebacteria bacterium]
MPEGYINIEGQDYQSNREVAPSHVSFAENNQFMAVDIFNETSKKLQKRYLSGKDLSNRFDSLISITTEPIVIQNLMEGNFNLINALIEQDKKG